MMSLWRLAMVASWVSVSLGLGACEKPSAQDKDTQSERGSKLGARWLVDNRDVAPVAAEADARLRRVLSALSVSDG